MATVYKIEIEMVSAFVSYDEETIKSILENFLKEYKDDKTKLGFENIKTEVKIIA